MYVPGDPDADQSPTWGGHNLASDDGNAAANILQIRRELFLDQLNNLQMQW